MVKLHYEKFLNTQDHSPMKFQEWMEKIMDQVKKDRYLAFYKHFPMCDLSIGSYFLKEIHHELKALDVD